MYQYKEWMNDLPTGMSGTYWSHEGTHQREADFLANFVPAMGESDDPIIEVIRNMQNFYYDRYNNGHCNPCRTKCAVPVRAFMKKHGAPADLKFKVKVFDSELEKAMDWIIFTCYKLFISRPGTKVRRINKDNYPICKEGEVGVVVEVTEDLGWRFGSLKHNLKLGLVIVDFGGPEGTKLGSIRRNIGGCLVKHLEIVKD